jgi:hypothetical protein
MPSLAPTASAGATSSGRRRRRTRSTPPATRSAPTNCRPSRSCSPRTTWWTSCSTTRSARGTPARSSPRIPTGRHRPERRTNSARPSRWRAARGNTCASSSARTASGRPPPAPSTAGRRRRRTQMPRPVHGQRAFRGGDVRAAGGLAPGRGKLDEADAAVAAVIRDNLFGLEIDPRCTQIAAFNLALAAWRRVGHCTLPAMHLACSGLAPNAKRGDWLKLGRRQRPAQRGMAGSTRCSRTRPPSAASSIPRRQRRFGGGRVS